MSDERPNFDQGRTAFADQPRLMSPAGAPPADGQVQIYMQNSVIGAQKIAIPRSDAKVMARIKSMAAMAGRDFIYRWEVNNRAENRKDVVEGPTIKCANAVAQAFGNCSVDCRLEIVEGGWIIHARFSDYETGYQLTRPFFQTNRNMMKMKDTQRATEMVVAIGVSKATRNVIVNALPIHIDYAMQEADRAVLDFVTAEPDRARAYIQKIAGQFSLSLTNAAKVIGRPFEKWTPRDLARVVVELKGVEEGTIDPNELWVEKIVEQPAETGSGAKAEQQVKEPEPATAETKPTETETPGAPVEAGAKPKAASAKKKAAQEPAQQAAPPPPPPADDGLKFGE